jgi:hypothetical protein
MVEKVVIGPVNNRHARGRVAKMLAESQTTEARSQDNDVFTLGHASLFNGAEENATARAVGPSMKREPARTKTPDGDSMPRLRLRVTAAAEATLRRGHPWLFAESVREQNREGTAGDLAVIYDRQDKFLAVGLFDPDSPIRLRVLHAGKPQTLDETWWSARLEAAVGRRDGLFDNQTTGYRLINGESDGWPGLVLDRYDKTMVLKLYTAAWLPRLEEIVELIRVRLKPERIVLRTSRNVQNIIESWGIFPNPGPLPFRRGEGEATSRSSRTWRDGGLLYHQRTGPEAGAPIIFLESGLRFEADVVRGQKTGFFSRSAREPAHCPRPRPRPHRAERVQFFRGLFTLMRRAVERSL